MKTDITVYDDRWLPIVQQAMETLSGRNLPKPAGMEDDSGPGAGYALKYLHMQDGRIRCYLSFRCSTGGRYIKIGSWFVEPSKLAQRKIERDAAKRNDRLKNAPAGSTIERRDDGSVFVWYPRAERVVVKLVMPPTCPTCGRALEQS